VASQREHVDAELLDALISTVGAQSRGERGPARHCGSSSDRLRSEVSAVLAAS
jgi:hypothetical protein